jgi:hypothetical protein
MIDFLIWAFLTVIYMFVQMLIVAQIRYRRLGITTPDEFDRLPPSIHRSVAFFTFGQSTFIVLIAAICSLMTIAFLFPILDSLGL